MRIERRRMFEVDQPQAAFFSGITYVSGMTLAGNADAVCSVTNAFAARLAFAARKMYELTGRRFAPILRGLNRMRAELARQFLRAIRPRSLFMEQSKHASANQQSGGSYAPPSKDIVETAIFAGNFTMLISAVKTAGLTDTLTGKGPFTVFAPTDEAFEKLPSGALDALIKDTAKLKAVLSYHVVKGYLLAKDVKAGEVMTVQGNTLVASVSSSGMKVNGAEVKQADIAATNGVVHVIDAVIVPKNWQLGGRR
jgi:uncharacterized surface protein with fasciclin (FAS1) repeats